MGLVGTAKHLSGRGLGLSLVSSNIMCLYRHPRYYWKEDRICNTLIIKLSEYWKEIFFMAITKGTKVVFFLD